MRTSSLALRCSLAAIAVLAPSLALAQIQLYKTPADSYSYNRVATFDFDGSTPFRVDNSPHPDLATLQFNGQQINGTYITSDGSPYPSDHIKKVTESDGATVTRVILRSGDLKIGENYRTQLNTYPIEPYKRYILDLEFKLDPSWNFTTAKEGLLWQMKGQVTRNDQGKNPVVSIYLHGDQLRVGVRYPESATHATTWPIRVSWNEKQYVPFPFDASPKTIKAGEYYRIQMIFFADDRPDHLAGSTETFGKGFLKVFFNDEPWIDYKGPTQHPDLMLSEDVAARHYTSFGWYQYGGEPDDDRIIYFRKHRLYEWK